MPELYRDLQARVLQNVAPELQIFGLENLAHAARAEFVGDLAMQQLRADQGFDDG